MLTANDDSNDAETIAENPYAFAGTGVRDRTTDWVHYGARYYSTRTGAFTQQDTLDAPLDPLNANRYAYAGGDPINLTDPTGANLFEDLFTSAAACYGGAGVGSIAGAAFGSLGAVPGAASGAVIGGTYGCLAGIISVETTGYSPSVPGY